MIKVETWDRENAVGPERLVPVFHGAWMQENEAYDLLGITLRRPPEPAIASSSGTATRAGRCARTSFPCQAACSPASASSPASHAAREPPVKVVE